MLNRQEAISTNSPVYAGRPCKKCGSAERRTLNGNCLNCEKHSARDWRKTTPGKEATQRNHRERYHLYKGHYSHKSFEYHLKHKYGLSLDEYNSMMLAQDGKCAICKEKFSKLVVDHNHETGRNRELLCNPCNLSLGFLKENIEIVLHLKDYIVRHNAS